MTLYVEDLLVYLTDHQSVHPTLPFLPFPRLPLGAQQSNIFLALGERNLISIGQLCNYGFSVLFTAKDVSLIGPTTTLKVTRNTDNGL